MRLSSSRSDRIFAGVFAHGRGAPETGDEAWLRALLDVERVLAGATGAELPDEAFDPARFDLEAIGLAAASGGNPVIPLVDQLPDGAHAGATSQDILDTAMMLIAQRALTPLVEDARAVAARATFLAREHADTPMTGRTLLQQAEPTTFGRKAAAWATSVASATDTLAAVPLPVQMGGPVGARDDGVAAKVAQGLGLEDAAPWQSDRVPVARLGAALGVLGGALGKVGRDVALLSQNEVGEVREGAPGGSSSMKHKRNPVASVALVACATRTPGLVATLLAAMLGEHERAAGAWHAEWETLGDLLRLTGSAAAWGRELLDGLQVDAERMRANLR
jgi:3-carboxy-cis,cis-muconate cycloisomerase